MRYRDLGRTGERVSEIGHGLWGMGSWDDADDDQSRAALAATAERGCTFYDSARIYGDGRSDALLGAFASEEDGRLLLASKVPPRELRFPPAPDDRWDDMFPLEHVLSTARAIRESLRCETIPLLQFHVWQDAWLAEPGFEETVVTLRSSGLARYVGVSLNTWQPWSGLEVVRSGLIDTVQVVYNVFEQAPEDELFPACAENSVGVIARVALDEGALGGKMTRDTRFAAADWRAGYFTPDRLEQTMDRVDSLRTVLPDGMSLAELALRFVLSNQVVSTVIVGMRKPEHVTANLLISDTGPLDEILLADLRAHRWDRARRPAV